MRRVTQSIIAIALALALGASRAAHAADPNGGYQSQQGLYLHGTAGSPFEAASADIPLAGASLGGKPATLAMVDGQLVANPGGKTVTGAALVGAVFHVSRAIALPAAHAYTLAITGASQHINIYTGKTDGPWQYDVTWIDTTKLAPAPLPNAPRPAPRGMPLCAPRYAALAVPGSWRSGQLESDAATISFACVPAGGPSQCADWSCDGGVIAKCIDYGYAPWTSGARALGGASKLTALPLPQRNDDAARQFHNLCAVAMRADYAGDGHPHTLEGTPIALFDATDIDRVLNPTASAATLAAVQDLPGALSVHLPRPAGPPASLLVPVAGALSSSTVFDLKMEAIWVWDPSSGSHGRAAAGCVHKARWSVLPPSITSLDCDRYAQSQGMALRPQAPRPAPPAFVISYSAHMDQELYRFGDGSHDLTTAHVTRSPATGDLAPDPAALCSGNQPQPGDNCPCYANYHLVSDVGTVLSPDVKDLVAQFAASSPVFRSLGTFTSYKHDLCADPSKVPVILPHAQPPTAVSEGYLFSTVPSAGNLPASVLQAAELVVQKTGGGVLTGTYATFTTQASAALSPCPPAGPVFGGTCMLGYVLQRDGASLPDVRLLLTKLAAPVTAPKVPAKTGGAVNPHLPVKPAP